MTTVYILTNSMNPEAVVTTLWGYFNQVIYAVDMQYTTLMRGNYLQSSLCAGLQIFTRKLIFSRLILQPAIWESFYLRSHSLGLLWRRTLSRSFPEKPKLRDRILGSRLLMQMHAHTLSSYPYCYQRYSPQNQNFQAREQERETVLSSRGGKTWSAASTWLYSLAEPNPNTRQTNMTGFV